MGAYLVVGLALFGVGLTCVIIGSAATRPFAVLLFIGLWWSAWSTWFFVVSARRVVMHEDGSVTFVGRKRELVVPSGQLISVSTFIFDWAGWYPMSARATSGRIRFWPPSVDEDALFALLAEANPKAEFVSGRSWLTRYRPL
jgi:hypothetical protein